MRVDYVTVQSRLDDGPFAEVAERVWQRALNAGIPSRSYRANPIAETIARPRGFRFMVWGEEAHRVFLSLKEEELHFVTRLDVRRDWAGIPGSTEFANIITDLVARKPKVGRANLTMYKSRPRSNARGRDTGGFGFRLGSLKSERSFKLYVRGNEGMVTEVTIQDGLMPSLLREGEVVLSAGYADSMHEGIMYAACERAKALLTFNTGFTVQFCGYLAVLPDISRSSAFTSEAERLEFFHNLLLREDAFVLEPVWRSQEVTLC